MLPALFLAYLVPHTSSFAAAANGEERDEGDAKRPSTGLRRALPTSTARRMG
jgi:hypothetical protein